MKLRLKYQLVLYYILVIAIVAIAILVYIEGASFYQYAVIALIAILVTILIYLSKKLTKPLKAFNDFFNLLQSNKKDFSKLTFPDNEYGDIISPMNSRHPLPE